MVSLQVVLLGAPASLASIMVVVPHNAAVTHVGDSSEVGQRAAAAAGKGATDGEKEEEEDIATSKEASRTARAKKRARG
jgi:hypothetical protein